MQANTLNKMYMEKMLWHQLRCLVLISSGGVILKAAMQCRPDGDQKINFGKDVQLTTIFL